MNTKLNLGLCLSILLNGSLIAGGFDQLPDMPKDTRYEQAMDETPSYEAGTQRIAIIKATQSATIEDKRAHQTDDSDTDSDYDSETDVMTEMINMYFPTESKRKKTKLEHTCIACCLTFKIQKKYISHMHDQHNDDYPFKCDYVECGKIFRRFDRLIKHKQNHTDEKPYKCNNCPYATTRSDDLEKHKVIHTGEKPYICKICANKFNQRSHLTEHMKIHTGTKSFACNICKIYTSSYKSALTRHIRKHTGEKPYICDYEGCHSKTSCSANLKKHTRKHTGEKPYICEICHRGFTQSSHLNKHMDTHIV